MTALTALPGREAAPKVESPDDHHVPALAALSVRYRCTRRDRRLSCGTTLDGGARPLHRPHAPFSNTPPVGLARLWRGPRRRRSDLARTSAMEHAAPADHLRCGSCCIQL